MEEQELKEVTELEAGSEAETTDKSDAKKKTAYIYAVGKRKTAIAQVRLYKKGDGSIEVNKKPFEVYFPTAELQETVNSPLKLVGQFGKLKITIKVLGGGKASQSEAVRHGISRTLIQLNQNFRKPLKKAEFLTRDARKKERKKPGLKGARRAPQWTKR